MPSWLLAAVIAGAVTAGTAANAALTYTGTVGGSLEGQGFATFDGLALGNAARDLGDIGLSFTGTAEVVRGNRGGRYAAPSISGDNGLVFGNPTGQDRTEYLSTGVGSISFQFDAPQRYFGLLWGSVDSYNSLEFFRGLNSVGSLTGSTLLNSPNGNQGVTGTLYVNIYSDQIFDRVVARSTSYAFELDNVSYGDPRNTPSGIDAPQAFSMMAVWLAGAFALARRGLKRTPRVRIEP